MYLRVWQFSSTKASKKLTHKENTKNICSFALFFLTAAQCCSTLGVSQIKFAGGVPSNRNKSIVVEEKSQWKGFNSLNSGWAIC